MNTSNCLFFAVLVSIVFTNPAFTQDDKASQTELELLQKSGKPIKLTDLKPEPVADEENAATWLAKADAGRLAIDMALAEEFNFDEDCNEAFIKKYQGIVAKHPDTYDWILKAAGLEHFVPDRPFDQKSYKEFTEAHDSSVMRSYARVLMYRSAVELAEGRADNAARSAVAMLELSRLPNRYLGMTGYLTRKAVQRLGSAMLAKVIDTGKVTDAGLLQEMQIELAKHDSLDDLVACIDSERAMGIRIMKDQGVSMVARIEPYLLTMRLVQERLGETIGERPKLFTDDDTAKPRGITAAQLMPAIQQMRGAAHRELDQIRRLRIHVAFLQNPDAKTVTDLDLPTATKTEPRSGETFLVDRPEK